MSIAARVDGVPGNDLWGYFLFSHGWSWLWWGVNVVAGFEAFGTPGVVFTVLGGLGPLLGGVVMTQRTYGASGHGDLWRRLTDVRRIPLPWWLVVVGVFPATTAGAAWLALRYGRVASLPVLDVPVGPVGNPLGLVAYLSFVLLLGPLPEEIGWRGYLLDRFQVRTSALWSGLAVGLAWAIWHAPLFLMPGYYDGLSAAPDPTVFATSVVVGSVLYTWLYNNTGRSVLAAVLFHFVANLTAAVVVVPPVVEELSVVLTVALAVVVVLVWGPRDLRRGRRRPLPPGLW